MFKSLAAKHVSYQNDPMTQQSDDIMCNQEHDEYLFTCTIDWAQSFPDKTAPSMEAKYFCFV